MPHSLPHTTGTPAPIGVVGGSTNRTLPGYFCYWKNHGSHLQNDRKYNMSTKNDCKQIWICWNIKAFSALYFLRQWSGDDLGVFPTMRKQNLQGNQPASKIRRDRKLYLLPQNGIPAEDRSSSQLHFTCISLSLELYTPRIPDVAHLKNRRMKTTRWLVTIWHEVWNGAMLIFKIVSSHASTEISNLVTWHHTYKLGSTDKDRLRLAKSKVWSS